MNFARTQRKLHSWAAILASLPIVVVIVTGLLLQVKKQVSWVQPPTQKGAGKVPAVSFEQILAAGRSVPEAQIQNWEDIDRVDLRPSHGMAKLRSRTGWEVQVDAQSGAVLQSAFRRSDFIEAMHDGSFFHEQAKLWIFLPSGLLLLLLWITGLYLWLAPRLTRLLRRRLPSAASAT
jgi:uncharacterized iron-regulated membrane protein